MCGRLFGVGPQTIYESGEKIKAFLMVSGISVVAESSVRYNPL